LFILAIYENRAIPVNLKLPKILSRHIQPNLPAWRLLRKGRHDFEAGVRIADA
jgi:hypothetical protein